MFRQLAICSIGALLVSCGGPQDGASSGEPDLGKIDLTPQNLSGPPSWELDRAASSIAFRATQNGKDFEGSFGRWNAGIIMNPQAPEEEGEIEAVIDLSSADAGSSDRNEALPDEGWFNTALHSRAVFRSSSITATGDGTYNADGTLTIKGVTREVAMPFTLNIDDTGKAIADGSVILDRSDFGIGSGEFADDKWVGYEVEVLLHMEAVPAG
jgi:polyisoprenoid-binding protein YceI